MRRYAFRKIVVALLAAACCSRLAAQNAPPSTSAQARTIYTSVPLSNSVVLIYSSTNSVVGSIAIPAAITGGAPSIPGFIALAPDGKFLFVIDKQTQVKVITPQRGWR
jgi:hypothetical protein